MTDVVAIAKECRETLVVEIAKLDEFLVMAEKLMKYNHSDSSKASSGKASEADDKEATELTSLAKIRPYSGANGAADTKA